MERIHKALKRIKSWESENKLRATGTSSRNDSVIRKKKTANGVDSLANAAKKVRLDTDILAENRIISDEIDPSIRTSYKMLRTRIIQRMRSYGWQSLAITSATQGDGKTITAINLALSIAGDINHNVCLVDLDLRHPSIANYMGLKSKNGVSACLKKKLPLADAVVSPNIDRLLILPNYTTEVNSSELLSSPTMQDLADELTQDPRRIVIYDMPPVLAADDMLAFSPNIDAVLFVVAEGLTARTDVMKAFELLENTDIIGTLLNGSDERTAAYY